MILPTQFAQDFSFEDLFFSVTDKKGIIVGGNDVFARIANYSIDELKGKPHNIIRHPEMPRAVFWLLWDYLENGKPIAAYVKNMASNGNYYWVMALALPVGNHYLSVRLKPAGPLFDTIQPFYQGLRDFEKGLEQEGIPRKEVVKRSVEKAVEQLQALGFASYSEFMERALAESLSLRCREVSSTYESGRVAASHHSSELLTSAQRIGSIVDSLFVSIDHLLLVNKQTSQQSGFIHRLAQSIRRLSLNAVVQAARLQEEGLALGVVADQLGRSSTDSDACIGDLRSEMGHLSESLRVLGFEIAATKLLVEMLSIFLLRSGINDAHSGDDNVFVDLLKIALISLSARLSGTLEGIRGKVRAVDEGVQTLHQRLLELKCIQFAGQIESQRIPGTVGFSVAFEEILRSIETATGQLNEFEVVLRPILASGEKFEILSQGIRGFVRELSSGGSGSTMASEAARI